MSVIIPTKNRLDETIRAAQSALNQTFQVSEIIIVDDGSDFAVQTKLQEYASKNGITYIVTRGMNHPGHMRNIGLERIDSTWIAFLDSDDEWWPEKIEKQLQAAKMYEQSALCTQAMAQGLYEPRRLITNIESGRQSRLKLFKSNFIVTSSVLIKTEMLKRIGGFETSYYARGVEDYSTWLRVSAHTNWYFLDEALVNYSDRPSSSIRSDEPGIRYPTMHAYILNIERTMNQSQTARFFSRALFKCIQFYSYLQRNVK